MGDAIGTIVLLTIITAQWFPPFLLSGSRPLEERPGAADFIRDCAAAMLKEMKNGGRTALYLGGEALSSGRAAFRGGQFGSKNMFQQRN